MTDLVPYPPNPQRVRVPLLEVEVTPLSAADAASFILERARSGDGAVIGNLNLHGVFVFHTDPDFREFCDGSDLVLVDGAPVAWAGGISTALRVGSTDWLDLLMPAAEGMKILAVGGSPETAHNTERYMRARFPSVHWKGFDGFEGAQVDDGLKKEIDQADILLVGMGMPMQEKWLMQHKDLLKGKVVANVGGCLDYYAGTQPLAPRWIGRLGFEWAYRLARDPRRLATRYLVEPFKLMALLSTRRRSRRRRL